MATAPQTARKTAPASSRIFRYLLANAEPRTKQEIATDLGLSLPTVYQGLDALEERQLVRPAESRSSTGGRRATPYTVNDQGPLATGISLTGTSVRIVIINLAGRWVVAEDYPLDATKPDQLGAAARARLEELLEREGLDARPLAGACIALPAIIDPASTGPISAPSMGCDHLDPALLTDGYPCPVSLANDASCGGYAECFGAQSPSSLAYLSLERGVGGAVIVNGTPHEGANGRAGEFGHMTVEPGGKLCHCGDRGHLEAYCSMAALSDELGITIDEFFSRLPHCPDDPVVAPAWESFLSHLAQGIAIIRMANDVDVVIGGLLASPLLPYLDEIRERVAEYDPFTTDAKYVRIARHPFHGVPLGAARKALAAYIQRV